MISDFKSPFLNYGYKGILLKISGVGKYTKP